MTGCSESPVCITAFISERYLAFKSNSLLRKLMLCFKCDSIEHFIGKMCYES